MPQNIPPNPSSPSPKPTTQASPQQPPTTKPPPPPRNSPVRNDARNPPLHPRPPNPSPIRNNPRLRPAPRPHNPRLAALRHPHLRPSSPPHRLTPLVPPRYQPPARQAIFLCGSLWAGCSLVDLSNTAGYLATMKRAPPLGCLWFGGGWLVCLGEGVCFEIADDALR
ncbi:deacetylase-like protein [Ophiocordyceps camponoti-floridani]|uniref:Deacetylase-like protein n=1 Tax=Ophiocordyceps camponoti-floridani TaxID=2030778 RepID=A0A8H4Q925_9HYPO|nr:deacetylase-like protein [Ophiocordyceps camponoti-floridani]